MYGSTPSDMWVVVDNFAQAVRLGCFTNVLRKQWHVPKGVAVHAGETPAGSTTGALCMPAPAASAVVWMDPASANVDKPKCAAQFRNKIAKLTKTVRHTS